MLLILLLLNSVVVGVLGFGGEVEVVTQPIPPPPKPSPPFIPPDAGFSRWSHWGPCTSSCGFGRRARQRVCFRGLCLRSVRTRFQSQEQECSLPECPAGSANSTTTETVRWLEWSEWEECSVSCNGGQKKRESLCEGSGCEYHGVEQFTDCNLIPCPEEKQIEQ